MNKIFLLLIVGVNCVVVLRAGNDNVWGKTQSLDQETSNEVECVDQHHQCGHFEYYDKKPFVPCASSLCSLAYNTLAQKGSSQRFAYKAIHKTVGVKSDKATPEVVTKVVTSDNNSPVYYENMAKTVNEYKNNSAWTIEKNIQPSFVSKDIPKYRYTQVGGSYPAKGKITVTLDEDPDGTFNLDDNTEYTFVARTSGNHGSSGYSYCQCMAITHTKKRRDVLPIGPVVEAVASKMNEVCKDYKGSKHEGQEFADSLPGGVEKFGMADDLYYYLNKNTLEEMIENWITLRSKACELKDTSKTLAAHLVEAVEKKKYEFADEQFEKIFGRYPCTDRTHGTCCSVGGTVGYWHRWAESVGPIRKKLGGEVAYETCGDLYKAIEKK
jgi:hypothetical protein